MTLTPREHQALRPTPRAYSVADLLAQHSEEELIDLKLSLRKQVDRMQFEIEQFDQALALKAAISDV